jgi:hypothetical protein
MNALAVKACQINLSKITEDKDELWLTDSN